MNENRSLDLRKPSLSRELKGAPGKAAGPQGGLGAKGAGKEAGRWSYNIIKDLKRTGPEKNLRSVLQF